MKIDKDILAKALHDAIDSYEALWKSEFEGTNGIPYHNNKQIENAKAVWNSYILHKRRNKK
jgi:hypothetical protein